MLGALRQRAPRPLKTAARRLLVEPRWGQLRRTKPFDDNYGIGRGFPIDRVYLEQFVAEYADDVRGEVLEVKDSRYTEAFGGDKVTGKHVVDIDPDNPRTTIVADLSEPGSLPSDRFDCVIVTQTLQYIPDAWAAVANCWQSLAPGGALLVSFPFLTRVEPFLGPEGDFWRVTQGGLGELLRRSCPGAEIDVRGYGNVLVAVAYLMGMARQDLREREIDFHDSGFDIVVCGRARKAGRGATPS